MNYMISLIFKILLVVFIIVVLASSFRTWQLQNDSRQAIFSSGTTPDSKINGFYDGTIDGRKYSWIGKRFNSTNSTGINVFDDGFESANVRKPTFDPDGHFDNNGFNTIHERYSFITYLGRGELDYNLNVLKIDYNVSGNPFWIRPFLDEIVQIAPDQYLGKMQLRIFPNFSFGILYFELKKYQVPQTTE